MDLGVEFSQSDSLLTHAFVGIPGFSGTPWLQLQLRSNSS